MRAIVFLDFDGVLNDKGNEAVSELTLYPDLMEHLNDLLRASNASIVVSSNWRRDLGLMDLQDVLGRAGLCNPRRVVDVTPDHGFFAPRGNEIEEYLQVRRVRHHPFVILDDRRDMSTVQQHLVRTKPDRGLRGADVAKAIGLLAQQKRNFT